LQLGEFLDQLIDYWRDLMVAHCSGLESQVLSKTGAHRDALLKQAQALELDTILAGLDILVSAKGRLRTTANGRVVLEMAIVRLSRLEDLVSLSQLAQILNQGDSGAAPSASRPQTPRTVLPPEAEKKKTPEVNNEARAPHPSLPAEGAAPNSQVCLRSETVNQIWSQVLAQVGPMLAGELGKAAEVAISGPNTLVLRFPASYNLDGNQYLDPTRVGRIEELLRRITGQTCNLRIESSGAPSPTAPSGLVAEETETSQSRSRRLLAEAAKQPLVTRAMEVLGAQIVQMDEGFGAAPAILPPTAESEKGTGPFADEDD
jgi:DNA polymerase-3 subunit gamma/tau